MSHTEVEIDWTSVRKQTLWSYEDLIGKLLSVLAYDFVQEHYNHSMEQAQDYAENIRRGYLQDRGNMTVYIDSITANLRDLKHWSGTYSKLVHSVTGRMRSYQKTDFGFDRLIRRPTT
jgi:hypothetical protein